MVKYWLTQDSVEAKVYKSPKGHYEMKLKGEKYPMYGYPRGNLLFGKLSPLKHWIKNKVFNDVWAQLDKGTTDEEITSYLKTEAYPYVFDLAEGCKYEMVPYEMLIPPMKEFWRALEAVDDSEMARKWKEIITFIFQEDDAYRMRFQWLSKFFPKWRKPQIKDFIHALEMMEHAEVVGDMKEKARLVKRVLLAIWEDPKSKETFEKFLKECDWKKVELSKADKYYFRAKYFKVDYPECQY